MQFAIIASKRDPAGITIHKALRELFSFSSSGMFDGNQAFINQKEKKENESRKISLCLINAGLIESDELDKKIGADIFIFASKHRSSSNTKSFAIHSIGNWAEAKAGGKLGVLCPSSAILQYEIFKSIRKSGRAGYEITMEATHHGPYMEKPSIFVEVGSTEEEWNDPENGKIIANAIMQGIDQYRGYCLLSSQVKNNVANADQKESPISESSNEEKTNENGRHVNEIGIFQNEKNKGNGKGKNNEQSGESIKTAIGIGGPHYCNNFNKLSESKSIAFGHICPKYHLDRLNEDLIRQALEKSREKVDMVVLDWKGLGGEKQRVVGILGKFSIPIERADKLLK